MQQNDENTIGIEQKLNGGGFQAHSAPRVVIVRKAKRKDDGPLEILCRWTVKHQIGMIVPPYDQLQSFINQISRALC